MRIPFILSGLLWLSPAAAETEDFSFDWSGQTDRHLQVNLLNGGLTVQGIDGDRVLVSVNADANAIAIGEEATEDGLRRLPTGGQDLVVRQEGGEIIVRAGSMDEAAQVTVRMPRDARLTVHAAMDGAILVEDVAGEMQVNSSSGPVEVRGLRNTAVIHAHADDLTASLADAALPGPIVLTSWAGDVLLRVPGALDANLRWRSTYGEVLTDLELEDVGSVTERETSADGVRLEGFTTARLNDGGPEISVTAYTGDIRFLRQD